MVSERLEKMNIVALMQRYAMQICKHTNVQWSHIIYFLIGRPVLESQDLGAFFLRQRILG